MSTEYIAVLVTIILMGTAWYLVKNDIKIWKLLYSKKSLGLFLIFSIVLSFSESYSNGSEGFELLFDILLNSPLVFLIFLIMGLPLLGVSLALLSIVFTKEYRDGLSKDLDETKRKFGEAADDVAAAAGSDFSRSANTGRVVQKKEINTAEQKTLAIAKLVRTIKRFYIQLDSLPSSK